MERAISQFAQLLPDGGALTWALPLPGLSTELYRCIGHRASSRGVQKKKKTTTENYRLSTVSRCITVVASKPASNPAKLFLSPIHYAHPSSTITVTTQCQPVLSTPYHQHNHTHRAPPQSTEAGTRPSPQLWLICLGQAPPSSRGALVSGPRRLVAIHTNSHPPFPASTRGKGTKKSPHGGRAGWLAGVYAGRCPIYGALRYTNSFLSGASLVPQCTVPRH